MSSLRADQPGRPAPRTRSTWRLPFSIELTIDAEGLAACDVHSLLLQRAIDRPDRLEVRLTSSAPSAPSAPEPLAFGRRATVRMDAKPCFSGTVDSVGSGLDEAGGQLSVIASARYQALRAAVTATYYQVTDAELARRLAGELELAPVVDPTLEVHPHVAVRGNPLTVLRAAAVRNGHQLAVTGGRLYFVRCLPILEDVRPPDFGREVLACEWRCSRLGGRRGRIEVLGSSRWRPLAGFHLRSGRGGQAGAFRVDRVVHSLGPSGFRSELEVVERASR